MLAVIDAGNLNRGGSSTPVGSLSRSAGIANHRGTLENTGATIVLNVSISSWKRSRSRAEGDTFPAWKGRVTASVSRSGVANLSAKPAEGISERRAAAIRVCGDKRSKGATEMHHSSKTCFHLMIGSLLIALSLAGAPAWAGFLFVANQGGNTIREFSHAGVDLGDFATTGLQGPTALAFDKHGIAPALGLRAGGDGLSILSQTASG